MQVIPLKIMFEQNKYFRPNRSTIIAHTISPAIAANEEMAKLTKIFPPNLAIFIDIP
jgi:hypothetical protein